jgi:Fur family transcriptional regulator, peroxide stress response regulator
VDSEGDPIGHRLERFRAAAHAAGIKLTHQRLEIVREIAASTEHPDAETIFRAVQPRMATVSLDTVYRTLWLLSDLGLITTLNPTRGNVRFDANLEPHHHYVCVRCGLARDFEGTDPTLPQIAGAAGRFGSVLATRVEVRGVCNSCAAKEAAGPPAGPATP